MVRKLSILVPVFNEVSTVGPLLDRLAGVRFPIEREIIVIDDGSGDGSRRLLSRMAETGFIKFVSHTTNLGKGAAIQTGLRHCSGDVVVIQDADLELDPNDLPGLLEPIRSNEAKVCFGSRFLAPVPWSVRCRPTYWANRLLNALSNLLNGIRITDFNTCYKMMTTEVVSRISITQNGFEMEPEITGKIARLGYRIAERPVYYSPRSVGEGKKIRFTDLLKYLHAMVRYRFFWSADQPSAPAVTSPVSVPLEQLRGPYCAPVDRALPVGANPES